MGTGAFNKQRSDAFALISMTNKDVYYINEGTARVIMDLLEVGKGGFVSFEDTRNNLNVSVSVNAISSIVLQKRSLYDK